ncbi:MAG: hypothetical protein GAK43_02660 [Stenotrophomonas maltophilia]|nr:MAG: hypothetical protein GAK43_02660 [Stenotrophomonas maltophilia]
MVDRWGVAEQAEPAERIDALVVAQVLGGNALPGHAMEAVAAGDVVAIQTHLLALVFEGDERPLGLHVVQAHVGGLVEADGAAVSASFHEIAGDFGLAIDGDALTAGQGGQVDTLTTAIQDQLETIVGQAFGIQALADAGLAQQVDATLFQYPGANASEHIVGGLALKDDVVDSGTLQQLAEQQASRAGADDGDTGFHGCRPRCGATANVLEACPAVACCYWLLHFWWMKGWYEGTIQQLSWTFHGSTSQAIDVQARRQPTGAGIPVVW